MAKDVTPILNKASTHTGVMRGRDVRQLLAMSDINPIVKSVLEQIAEINHTNTLAIAELAQMFDQMVNTMQGFSDVAGNMKETVDQMRRGISEGSEDESSLN